MTAIMEPHKEVLQDMVPPRKHLLRYQPANAQIGLMEGNTFCTMLTPRLFTIDLNTVEHKVFFNEVSVCMHACICVCVCVCVCVCACAICVLLVQELSFCGPVFKVIR